MDVVASPSPSRKYLVWSAFLFAVPLALVQGGTLFLSIWMDGKSALSLWFFGTAVVFVVGGGLCALRTTWGLDAVAHVRWGRRSSLLTGLFGSLLGLFVSALFLAWYVQWWIPSLSTALPHSCIPNPGPFDCMSPQMSAESSLIFLPATIIFFLAVNAVFVLLALLGGTLATGFRTRNIP